MVKKIIVIIFSILIFNACSTLDKQYSFSAIEHIKGISIVGSPKDIYSENSSLSSIWISDSRNWDGKERKLKLLDNKIKIIKDGREYIIPYSDIENKKNDINIYIKIVNIITPIIDMNKSTPLFCKKIFIMLTKIIAINPATRIGVNFVKFSLVK